jgi:DNA modification methylase
VKVPDVKILHGDCLDVLRTLPAESVHAVVSDPPYGLSFMGKKWDYDVPSIDIWRECLRVLKPGGHLLAFAGSRTYHRMAVNVEDAGFEIRDQVLWIYGSGFPKSLDVSKAIDNAAGVEREVVGVAKGAASADTNSLGVFAPEYNATAPATDNARKWQGWGTALKPAFEVCVSGRKPLTPVGRCARLVPIIWRYLCQSKSFVSTAKKYSRLSQNDLLMDEGLGSVQWSVESVFSILGDLCDLTDTLLSGSGQTLNLSTALLWLNTLVEALRLESRYTILTEILPTTDLKTLESLLSQNTLDCIAGAKTGQNGEGTSADIVADIFSGARRRLTGILKDIAVGTATAKAGAQPAHEPCVMARKPFSGTVAANVLEHGTGAINVDGCRVAGDAVVRIGSSSGGIWSTSTGKPAGTTPEAGRFPANLIHDGSDAVRAVFPDTGPAKSGGIAGWQKGGYVGGTYEPIERTGHDDDGGNASRFFYCAKASRQEREAGLGHLEATDRAALTGREPGSAGLVGSDGTGNNPYSGANYKEPIRNVHPTVKPIALMRYLVRLVTPPGGTVLDPFIGSGTTAVAAIAEGFDCIGIEREADYLPIIEGRTAHAKKKRRGRLL